MTWAFVSQLFEALQRAGVDLRALGLGLVRVLPVVLLVPAFGLRALPRVVQLTMALCLAVALGPLAVESYAAKSFAHAAIESALHGTLVALSAAVPLWAATMAGGVVDAVQGAEPWASLPVVEERAGGVATLMSLLASLLFLTTGGATRVLGALALPSRESSSLLQLSVGRLSAGIQIAVAVAGPVLVTAVLLEIARGMMSRSSASIRLAELWAPVRVWLVLAVTAWTLDRMVGLTASLLQG